MTLKTVAFINEFVYVNLAFVKAATIAPHLQFINQEDIDLIVERFILNGLNGEEPKIVVSATFLLGHIYQSTVIPADYLFSHFEQFYLLLGYLLFNFDDRSIHPKVLTAISIMILSPQWDIEEDNPFQGFAINQIPFEESLKELMNMTMESFTQLKSFSCKKDFEYGNQYVYIVYIYILHQDSS